MGNNLPARIIFRGRTPFFHSRIYTEGNIRNKHTESDSRHFEYRRNVFHSETPLIFRQFHNLVRFICVFSSVVVQPNNHIHILVILRENNFCRRRILTGEIW